MARPITLQYVLDVIPGDFVEIPGCEPTSAVTSATLSRFLTCNSALISLNDALEAIPGSTVKLLANGGGIRRKLFVLPPINLDCDPCPNYPDYYQILRDFIPEEEDDLNDLKSCEVARSAFCPSPNFQMIPAPRPDPYVEEGTILGATNGVLNNLNGPTSIGEDESTMVIG